MNREEEISAKWGVPHWRDTSSYPTVDKLTVDEWRWEFLRRNHDYRDLYRAPADIFRGRGKKEYFRRVFGVAWIKSPYIPAYRRKPMGQLFLYQMSKENSQPFRTPGPDVPLNWLQGEEVSPQEYYHLDVRLDLYKPITEQLNAIRPIAAQHRQRFTKRKKHSNQWPRYLQLLDARDQGAGYGLIRKVLYDDLSVSKPSVRNRVEQA